MKLFLSLVLLLVSGCAQTNYQVYEGRSANVIEGQGGTKEIMGGYEIWDNGNPPRRYQILGVSTVEDFDNVFGQQRLRSAIADQIRQAGGDAAIVLDGFSQGQSTSVLVLPKGRVAVGSTTGRKQVRYQIVKYLDSASSHSAPLVAPSSGFAYTGALDAALSASPAVTEALGKAEVLQTVVGRSHSFNGVSGPLKWDMRANRQFYSRTTKWLEPAVPVPVNGIFEMTALCASSSTSFSMENLAASGFSEKGSNSCGRGGTCRRIVSVLPSRWNNSSLSLEEKRCRSRSRGSISWD